MRVTHATEVKDNAHPRVREPLLWPWATDSRSLDTRESGGSHQPELPDQSSLSARGESSPCAGGAGRVLGVLASHDDGDDAAIQHADGLHDRACWPAAAAPICGSRSVPGWLCRRLDVLRARGFSGRYADSLARASLALARHQFLGDWRNHIRGRGGVPVQPAEGALSETVPQPIQPSSCATIATA